MFDYSGNQVTTKRGFPNNKTYRVNDGDVIDGQVPVWDRMVLLFTLISLRGSCTRTTEPTPTHARDMVFATSLALSSKTGYL